MISDTKRFSSLIICAIIVTSIALGYGASQYYNSVAERIRESTIDTIRNNAKVSGHTIAQTFENKLESVSANLEILAGSPAMNSKWLDRGLVLLTSAQTSTDPFVDEYVWADENGMVLQSVTSSTGNTFAQGDGARNIIATEYFDAVKKRTESHFIGYSEGTDGVFRLYISYPIMGAAGEFTDDLNSPELSLETESGSVPTFNGAVVASIELESLSAIVSDTSYADIFAVTRILDNKGTVLLSQGNPEFVGKNWFEQEVQASSFPRLVPDEQKEQVNRFNREALEKMTSQSIDFTRSGVRATLVSSPIFIEGSRAMTLFTRVGHDLPAATLTIIEEQKAISTVIISAIGAGAAVASFVFLSWNHRLRHVVNQRTQDLKTQTQVLNQANEKLLNHDRLQKEFINIAAHELRTPIQPLLGMAELLRSQFSDGKEKIEVSKAEVDMIVRNAERLEKLSSNILEASRIESKSLKLDKEIFSLDQKVRRVIEDIRPFVESAGGLKIEYLFLSDDGSERDVLVEADSLRIFEVVSNLLRNAIKFAPEETIKVTLSRRDSQFAQVSVSDKGKGIDPEILPKMFDRFSSKSEQGTGLGLFISKNIVEAHGGRIWGLNNSDGRGATFYFTLPIVQEKLEKL
jgi:signal transduction histidine kinase